MNVINVTAWVTPYYCKHCVSILTMILPPLYHIWASFGWPIVITVATTVPPFGELCISWATMAMVLPPLCLLCTTCCVTTVVFCGSRNAQGSCCSSYSEGSFLGLALNYYQHMGPVHHDVVVYSDSMSCLQAIEGEDTENPFICHIMNLLWSLSDKGTRVRFCWVPSHCGIDGNERVDQLAKETLDQDIDPLASVHYTDMKPLVNSYIQKLVQTKWDVAVHGRDLYLVKPTLGPPKKFQHLTRAEEVVITRLRIGHTKATKSHILSRGPPTGCHHCGQTLTIDHMLLECALLQECRDEYYTADSLNALFEAVPET